jgi:hypothetical protein
MGTRARRGRVYNVTDYDEINEWFPTIQQAKRAAIDWARAWPAYDPKTDHEIVVVACQLERLTRAYACKLLSGQGWAVAQETIYRARPRRKKNAT